MLFFNIVSSNILKRSKKLNPKSRSLKIVQTIKAKMYKAKNDKKKMKKKEKKSV